MNKVEMIEEAIRTLDAVEATSGKNDKRSILQAQQENDILKEMFYYTFNYFWTYNIKKLDGLDLVTEYKGDVELSYDHFFSQLKILRDRIQTGNKAIEETIKVLELAPLHLRKWLVRILFRELQAGIQIDTIKKVFGNYIPEYNVLLASKDLKKVKFPCFFEKKYDGMRCNIYMRHDGSIEMRTRNGKVFSGFNDIEREAKEKLVAGFMYDGELIGIKDGFKGIQKLAMKIEENKTGVTLNVYDMVPIEYMDDQNAYAFCIPFQDRRERLEEIFEGKDSGLINLVESFVVNNMEEAEILYASFLEQGYEGGMFKNTNMYYEKNTASKRSKDMIKLKPSETADLEILGLIEERDVNGNPKGTLGAITVGYKGFKVNVGSGLHDDDKDTMWANPKLYIGKIAEIEYDAESKNKKGELSLRFPRFKSIREDKDVADF